MAFFSKSPNGYLKAFKAGILLLVVVGLIRMLLRPIGIPISIGGPFISITGMLLICLLVYGFQLGGRGAPVGDLIALTVVLIPVYTAVDAFGLAASSALNLETYYTDPQHMGPDPVVGSHIMAHIFATPFFLLAGFIIALIAWGIGKMLGKRQ